MLKTFLSLSTAVAGGLLLLASSNTHSRAAPVDLSSLTCEQASNRIKTANGDATLVQTGQRTYTDIYRARFYCPYGSTGRLQSIRTADNAKCVIGYSCFPDSLD